MQENEVKEKQRKTEFFEIVIIYIYMHVTYTPTLFFHLFFYFILQCALFFSISVLFSLYCIHIRAIFQISSISLICDCIGSAAAGSAVAVAVSLRVAVAFVAIAHSFVRFLVDLLMCAWFFSASGTNSCKEG